VGSASKVEMGRPYELRLNSACRERPATWSGPPPVASARRSSTSRCATATSALRPGATTGRRIGTLVGAPPRQADVVLARPTCGPRDRLDCAELRGWSVPIASTTAAREGVRPARPADASRIEARSRAGRSAAQVGKFLPSARRRELDRCYPATAQPPRRGGFRSMPDRASAWWRIR